MVIPQSIREKYLYILLMNYVHTLQKKAFFANVGGNWHMDFYIF